MPTNEERSDAAARLRNYTNLRESFKESPICAFINALGFGGYLDWNGVCSRIADLIEPEPERTCRAKQDYDAMDDGIPDCRIWRCSCGEAFPFWRGCNPIFCPECGAKIIHGTEGDD